MPVNNREWIRLRRAYGATGCERTRIRNSVSNAQPVEGSRFTVWLLDRMVNRRLPGTLRRVAAPRAWALRPFPQRKAIAKGG